MVRPRPWGLFYVGKKIVAKEKIWSGHCCQKFFVTWIFFEPITTQSQPNHVSIFVHPTFAGPPNSLFFASFGINMPSPKSRDGCKFLEPVLVHLINRFVNTSGTSRWWSKQSNLFCILALAEKSCICWYQNAQIPITGNGYASTRIGISMHTGILFGSVTRTVLNYRAPICTNYQF
jgi:hypothetical protein